MSTSWPGRTGDRNNCHVAQTTVQRIDAHDDGRMAAELGIDKSIVGRWARGAVQPSADNLARLTALLGDRVAGFTILDWERDLTGLGRVLGVHPEPPPGAGGWGLGDGPHGEIMDQILAIPCSFDSLHPRVNFRDSSY